MEPREKISSLTPFLSEHPYDLMNREGSTLSEVPWLVGATEDEGASMYADAILNDKKLLNELNSEWESIAPKIFDYGDILNEKEQLVVSHKLKQFYFNGQPVLQTDRQALSNLCSDQLFLYGIYNSAVETTKRGKQPVYFYQYSYKGPVYLLALAFPLLPLKNPDSKFDSYENSK